MFKKSFSGNRNDNNRGGERNRSRGTFRPAGRFNNVRRAPRRGGGARIDPSRFINKVTVTEETEIFVPEHAFTDFLIEQKLKESIGLYCLYF